MTEAIKPLRDVKRIKFIILLLGYNNPATDIIEYDEAEIFEALTKLPRRTCGSPLENPQKVEGE